MDIAELHLHWGASSYKGNVYRSYSLARSFRKDGKKCKEIVIKLGGLTTEQATRWRDLLKAIKKPNAFFATLEDIVVTKRFSFLDVAVVNEIWDYWRLDDVFIDDDEKKLGCAVVARILTLNRCIDPTAKSQIPKWCRSTALPWMLDIDSKLVNTSRIFRELDIIANHKEAICKHVYERLRELDPDSMTSIFYDLSSTTFHGSRCVLMKWGHCKEGYQNHVILALVVNREGFPFYWEVLPGGTADSKTITWLLGRLEARFKVTGTTLIFDRGMVSDDNLASIEKAGIKYISAMDRNQLEGLTKIDFAKFSHLDPDCVEQQAIDLPGFIKLGDGTYFREANIVDNRRYILCFNPQLFKDQRKARNQVVENFRVSVENLNKELRGAKKSRQRNSTYDKFKRIITKLKLTDFIDVILEEIHVNHKSAECSEYNVSTYTGTVVIDEDEMVLAGKLDGFWLLVTNHNEKQGEVFNVSAQDIIIPYRNKAVIELSFRDIKAFIEVAPVHVWTETHVKAHYDVCVLSHLINRTLTSRLHENTGELTKDVIFHESLYEELSGCMIDRIEIENIHMSTYNMTRPTDDQKELLDRIGMKNLFDCDIIKKVRYSGYS